MVVNCYEIMTNMFAAQDYFDNVWSANYAEKYGRAGVIFAQDLYVYLEMCKTVGGFEKEYIGYIDHVFDLWCNSGSKNDIIMFFKIFMSHKIVFQIWYNDVYIRNHNNIVISGIYDKMVKIENYLYDILEENFDDDEIEIFGEMKWLL